MATWSAAIKEAYASATSAAVILHTLELYHSTWAGPVRVVQGFEDLTATLEASAPVNPSTAVLFTACPFTFTLPQQGQGQQRLTIAIDNVARLLMPILESADLAHPTPVRVIYRPYLSSDLSAPHMNPPLALDVASVQADLMRCSLACTYADFLNRKFPRALYRVEEFPGIAGRV